jgi:6-phosphogluconolactonase (cycloisomerase 2 family)
VFQNPARCVVSVWIVLSTSGCGSGDSPSGQPAAAPDAGPPRVQPAAPGTSVTPSNPTSSGELTLVEAVNPNDLATVVRSAISPDGRFLYAVCWNPGTLVIFARDLDTGNLTHVQTIDNKPELSGAGSVALSPDGRSAVVVAFRSKNAILFRRDSESGKLTLVDVPARTGNEWEFPVAAVFSPDGKFVCAADDGGRAGPGGVRVFRVEGDRLVDAGMDQGRNRCYNGARSVAFQPDGKTVFAACCRPGALVISDFDRETGATKVRQILWSGRMGGHDFSRADVGDVNGILGLTDVVASPDGRFVITCSGRFGGDSALTSFRYNEDGHLAFVEIIKSSRNAALNFVGGNQLAVSPDGRSVYAAGTVSGVVICTARDPQSGSLTPREIIADGGPAVGPGKMGAAGVTISPDGKFLYVATEDKSTVSVFRWKAPQ